MTCGEQCDIVNKFISKLENSENPEEELQRENVIDSFLKDLSNEELTEFQHEHDSFDKDTAFDDYIYKSVLGLNMDVKSEYLHLKKQVDDLLDLIDKRKQYLRSCQANISNKKSSEYRKLQELLGQTYDIEKEAKEQSGTKELISFAISNSRKSFFSGMIFYGSLIFPHMEWKIRSQDEDKRKYIDFGQLPVSIANKLIKLKNKDPELYLECFRKMIEELEIIEKIKHSISSNPLMTDRYHVVEEAMKYFIKSDYQMFAYIIVPQIEGFFKIYMQTMHIYKETFSIGDVVTKIHEQDNFLEYLYFKYDFPNLRNPVAHGDVLEASQEQAYEILMDLYWVIDKIDSEKRDYKQWMIWLKDFSNFTDKSQKIHGILDYFCNGIESKDRLDNLKYFLSHNYSEWIKKFNLLDVGKELCGLLDSEELYDTIWNESAPLELEKNKEKVGDEEFSCVAANEEPLKYSDFVEMMHRYNMCSDDWYNGYKGFIEELDKRLKKILEDLEDGRETKIKPDI